MSLTARLSHAKMGKPLPARLQTPKYLQSKASHRIYWRHRHRAKADQFNDAVSLLKGPCLRRYFEFMGLPAVARRYDYVSCYSPPSILSRPKRIWELQIDNNPFCTFTNLAEAWYVMMGLQEYGGEVHSRLIYMEL